MTSFKLHGVLNTNDVKIFNYIWFTYFTFSYKVLKTPLDECMGNNHVGISSISSLVNF